MQLVGVVSQYPRVWSRWGFLKYKLRWQLFTIVFPEVVTSMAAEQWKSANQSVQAFKKLGYPQWTMGHAFFADMGGFMLQCPDVPSVPVDGEQLAYLVEKIYLEYPAVDIAEEYNSEDTRATRSVHLPCTGPPLAFQVEFLTMRYSPRSIAFRIPQSPPRGQN